MQDDAMNIFEMIDGFETPKITFLDHLPED